MVNPLVKERLTGAIILVALIVLLVPELLNGPIRPASRARGAASEEPPLRAYTINLADEAHGGSVAPQPQAPTSVAPATDLVGAAPALLTATTSGAQAPTSPTVSPSQQPAAPPAPTGQVVASPPAGQSTGAKGGWMVQLGSFASRPNAERLAQEVRSRGFSVAVSRGSTGRRLYRVQVGPTRDHASAEQLAGKLRTLGHSGSIVPK